MKDGTYVINLDDKHIGFHYLLTAGFVDSFKVDYIPQDVLKKIKDDSITQNIFRI